MSPLYQTLKVCLVALVMVSCQSSGGTSENRLDHSANHRSSDLGMIRPASADMGDATALVSDGAAAAYDSGVNRDSELTLITDAAQSMDAAAHVRDGVVTNPCAQSGARCAVEAECIQTEDGNWSCRCADGFEGSGTECADIDECEQSPSPCPGAGVCQNQYGGFECICPAGFEWAEGDCQDVDECATANGFCGPSEHVQCINQVGEPPRCVDIDECLNDNGQCGDREFVACVNRLSEPPDCVLVDHCENANGGCGDPQFTACENQSDRMPICTDIDECESLNGGCGDPASIRCINRIAAEPLCEDVNECRNGPEAAGCAENADCINVLGGFICQCRDGFNGDGLAGFGCRDADECAINNGGCDQLCINQPGTFSCDCLEGERLQRDGRTCSAEPTCADGLRNQMESDIDCGGPNCPACELGARCRETSDCSMPSAGCQMLCDGFRCTEVCERGSCPSPGVGGIRYQSVDEDTCQQLEADNAFACLANESRFHSSCGCGCYPSDMNIPCPPEAWRCDDTSCVPRRERCDGVPQCSDRSDEAACPQDRGCAADQFTCDSGHCIAAAQLCDAVAQCPDESDERPARPACPAQCPALDACNRICPDGFAVDDMGCDQCSCRLSACPAAEVLRQGAISFGFNPEDCAQVPGWFEVDDLFEVATLMGCPPAYHVYNGECGCGCYDPL